MKRLALLAIPLFIVGCAQGPFATAPAQPEVRAVRAASLPQPSAQVRGVQQQLREIGIYSGPIDGIYGQKTQRAVERFQRNQQLAVTARLDGRTLDAIRDEARRSAEPLALSDPVHVRTVQNRLRQLGFYQGAADGVWGPEIQLALERFQRSRGLEASGGFNPTTALALGLDPNNLSQSAAAIARR